MESAAPLILSAGFVLIAVVNVWTLGVLKKNHELHTSGHAFVASLALSDAMVGVVFLLRMALRVPLADNPRLCLLVSAAHAVTCSASIFTIVCVAVDRYVFVAHPYFYNRVVTTRKVLLLLVPTWCLAAVIGTLTYHFGRPEASGGECEVVYPQWLSVYVMSGLFLLSIVVTGVLYGLISRLALRMQRPVCRVLVVDINTVSSLHGLQLMLMQKLRGVKMFAVVFGAFVLCWMPYHVTVVLGLPVSTSVHRVTSLIGAFNSLITFFIYLGMNTQFRKAFLRSIPCYGKSGVPVFFSAQRPRSKMRNQMRQRSRLRRLSDDSPNKQNDAQDSQVHDQLDVRCDRPSGQDEAHQAMAKEDPRIEGATALGVAEALPTLERKDAMLSEEIIYLTKNEQDAATKRETRPLVAEDPDLISSGDTERVRGKGADHAINTRTDPVTTEKVDPPAREGEDPDPISSGDTERVRGKGADHAINTRTDPVTTEKVDPPAREGEDTDPISSGDTERVRETGADHAINTHADPVTTEKVDPPAREREDTEPIFAEDEARSRFSI